MMWIAPVILVLAALVMVGCPVRPVEEPVDDIVDAADVDEFDLNGILLTTNGVPISIDTGQVEMNAQIEGEMMVSSFPEDADENDEDEVTLVFVVIPIADEPVKPSRYFVVSVSVPVNDQVQQQNWIVLKRNDGYPKWYKYQVIPRSRNDARPEPGDYLMVAVKIGADMELPEPPGELVMLSKSVAGLKYVGD
jgi:hypothetical protein